MADQSVSTFVRGGKAFLRDESGRLTTHDPGKVGARVLSGKYTPVTAEDVEKRAAEKQAEEEGALGAVKAGAEALASGAFNAAVVPFTVGGAALTAAGVYDENPTKDLHGRDLMATVFGGSRGSRDRRDYEAGAKARKEASPLTSGVGELTGQVGGALLSGGSSLAGNLGAAAAKRTGSRIVGGGVAGALEGAALGAAAAPEAAYFKDEDLTAESLLAGMGWGALLGGGVGLGAGAAGRLFSRSGTRGTTPLDSPRLPPSVGPSAPATEARSGLRGFLQDFSEERTVKALGARGTDIRKLGKTAGKAEDEMRRMARDVLSHKLDDGTPVFRALQSQDELVENLGRAQNEAGAKLGTLRKEVGEFLETKAKDLKPKTASIADRIEVEVAQPLHSSAVPDVAQKAVPIERMAAAVRSLGPEAKLEDLVRVRQDIDSIIYPKPTGPGLPALPPAHADQLVKVRGIVESEIEATMDKAVARMDAGRLTEYKELKGLFRSFREANQIAGKAQLQDLGNRVVSPTDYLTGAAVFAGDTASGGALSAVKAVAAGAAHKAVREHSSAMLAVLADRMAKNLDQKIGKSIGGFFSRAVSPAQQLAPKGVVVTRRAPSPARTATVLELFQGKESDPVKAYRKRVKEVAAATDNFGAAVRDRTEVALGDLPLRAPKLAGKIATAATKGAVFLASKVPTPTTNSRSFTPNADAPIPSGVEIAKFARYWSAVSNPLSVLRDLEDGTVTREQVEAVQAVYPRLYQRIQETVRERIMDADERGISIPYQARLQLDLLLDLGGAGEPTASPDFMLRFRGMQAATAEQQQNTPPPKPINISSRLRASRDRMESDQS